jgi:hypothetical protein
MIISRTHFRTTCEARGRARKGVCAARFAGHILGDLAKKRNKADALRSLPKPAGSFEMGSNNNHTEKQNHPNNMLVSLKRRKK